MEITVRSLRRVSVVELEGKLNLNSAAELRAAVYRVLDAGATGIVLNLDRVTFLDSSGLGALAAALTSARGRGVDLKLLRPSPKVLDVLKITGTDVQFEILENEAEAIESFAPGLDRSAPGSFTQ